MSCFKASKTLDEDDNSSKKANGKVNGKASDSAAKNNNTKNAKTTKNGKKSAGDIDKKLKEDKKKLMQTHKIPVVGAGESGKSTLIKQMQILFIQGGFSEKEKMEMVPSMRRNIRDGLLSITGAMQRLDPPVELENPELQELVDYIQNVSSATTFDYPAIFFEHSAKLWKDKGVQETFSRSHEYQLIDSAKYFLDKCDEVGREDFTPNEQDILRCRVLTSGIFETKFSMNKINFHMFDVGGQREERRKWIQVFHDITAVIYVSACSAYDMTLREDPSQNRMTESIELFETIWKNRFLRNNSVILFLNKQDMFVEKINAGKTKLETYFPDFAYWTDDAGDETMVNDSKEVRRAKLFIKAKFFEIADKDVGDNTRKCFAHYTTAVDTENIRRVFADCQSILQRAYMAKFGLL